jgi:hypothetical protein
MFMLYYICQSNSFCFSMFMLYYICQSNSFCSDMFNLYYICQSNSFCFNMFMLYYICQSNSFCFDMFNLYYICQSNSFCFENRFIKISRFQSYLPFKRCSSWSDTFVLVSTLSWVSGLTSSLYKLYYYIM